MADRVGFLFWLLLELFNQCYTRRVEQRSQMAKQEGRFLHRKRVLIVAAPPVLNTILATR